MPAHDICPSNVKTPSGRDAYLTLCELVCRQHCDGEWNACQQLSMWVSMLDPNPIELRELEGPESDKYKLPRRRLNLHSLDGYREAFGEFTPKRLKKIEAIALTLIKDIEALKRTPFVCDLRDGGRLHKGDLLRSLITPADAPFEGLLKLRAAANKVLGNPRKPKPADHDRYLEGMYRTIHHHTNHWHDRLVADILNDVLDRKQPITEGSLRNWRKDHRLVTKPTVRKK